MRWTFASRVPWHLASLMLVVGFTLAASPLASACNIPVFRYALERWQADDVEAIVFYRGSLSESDERLAASLQSPSGANVNFVRCDLDANPPQPFEELWQRLRSRDGESASLPHLVIRSTIRNGRSVTLWSGPLDDTAIATTLRSPARDELGRRLLRGDSVVYLLLRSPDEARTRAARQMLEDCFTSLRTRMALPEGIGLPGSELFSDVPLLIQFSVIEIDGDDPAERFLASALAGINPDAVADGEPLIVPVFGRGRALEVIPARDASQGLMEDLTLFLGAACSCQVKEQNPGFDLLLAVDWERELFGEDGQAPPATSPGGDVDGPPVLLTIPPGRKKR